MRGPEMKFLTLIRHAKSSHDNPSLTDVQRILNARGLRDAPAMGWYLREHWQFRPDLMISSHAVRAIHTARLIAAEIGYDEPRIRLEPRIYEAPVSSLLQVVREQADETRHLCLTGHNPGTEQFTQFLCGGPAVHDVVTCAIIMLELPIERWKDTGSGCAVLRHNVFPAAIGLGKHLD
jgi:phosphohistidine phosphatase